MIALLPQSKKIEKSLNQSILSKDSNQTTKSYNTFGNNQKDQIIKTFKSCLIDLEEFKTDMSDESFFENLDTIETETINEALRKILPQFVPSFKDQVIVLRTWRRKIKDWFKSREKPETRGGPLVPPERLEEFKYYLTLVLKKLKYRSFKPLQPMILSIFEEMHVNMKDKTCSKDWWYEFLNRNEDIAKLWSQLPIKINRRADMKEEDNNSSFNQSILTADTEDISVFMENVEKDFAALTTNSTVGKNDGKVNLTMTTVPVLEDNQSDCITNVSGFSHNRFLFADNEEFLDDFDSTAGFVFLPEITVELVKDLYQE